MGSKLKIDLDELEKTVDVYETEIKGFEDARDGVVQALDELKASGWVSEAGSAWFDAVDMSWTDVINYHIRVITELRKELKAAVREYNDVYKKQCELEKHLN